MAKLKNDMAWDTNSINEFIELSSAMLDKANRISADMESIISSVSATYNSIPADLKDSSLGQALGSASAGINGNRFVQTKNNIISTLNALEADSARYDNAIKEQSNELVGVLASIKNRADQIKTLLKSPDVTAGPDGLIKKIEQVKSDWEDKTKELEVRLREIQFETMGLNLKETMYSADPVNLSTGNFVYDHEDLKIGGDISISFHRYYNSLDRIKSSLGRCFVHNYDIKLEFDGREKATIRMHDGQRKNFILKENGIYTGLGSAKESFYSEEDRYVLQDMSGYRWMFDNKGRLLREENRHKRGISFTYYDEEDKLLKKAEADNGTSLNYIYEDGKLTCVEDNEKRQVLLTYENNKLATVITPGNRVYRYEYGETGRITELTNARQVTMVSNIYDEKNRVTHQDFSDGGSMEFEYDDKNKTVILTERNGAVIKYIHDELYRNVKTIYEDGTAETYVYNDRNQRTAYTDRNGNTTRTSYDDRGNITQVINAKKEKLNITYNVSNLVTDISLNGKLKVKNSYDANGNLIMSQQADGSSRFITYNEHGKTLTIEYPDKTKTSIEYDERGNISAVKQPTGAVTGYSYDELNRVTETTDGNGNKTTYEYNVSDKMISSTNPAGDTRYYEYNAGGMLTKVTDYDGRYEEASYNSIGKIEKITDREGNTTEYRYDKMWNISEIIHSDGGKIVRTYDRDNRPLEIRLPEGGLVCYAHDANGNIIKVTDPEGSVTSYEYDELNRPVKITDATGASMHTEYDIEGNITKRTDAAGNSITYTYDDMGRMTSKTNALGDTISYIYDVMGRLAETVYPNNTKETREYKNGRLSKVTKRDKTYRIYEYDANGNSIKVTDNENNSIRMEYDCLNRLTSVTNTEGEKQCYYYDCLGRMTGTTDALGNKTEYAYTPAGKLAMVRNSAGNETEYSYDCMGRLTEVKRYGSEDIQTTKYEWNLEGKLIKKTDALGNVETFTYDRCGRMTSKCDKDGYNTAYSYNSLGLMEKILYADKTDVEYTYDALRKLKEIKDATGITTMEYDILGRVISITTPDQKTTGYEWGSMGERRSITYPDGKKAVYGYDEAMKLKTLETAKGTIEYSYDSLGRLCQKELPNDVTTTYDYNSLGRLTAMSHIKEGFTEAYTYEYDAAGNRLKTTKTSVRDGISDNSVYEYGYDELYHLTEVKRNGDILRRYGYDSYGNRIRKEDFENGGQTTAYTYNGNNQLVTGITGDLEEVYGYDRRGNLTSVTSRGNLIKSYTFDLANRMTSATEHGEDSIRRAEYAYNGMGHRISQSLYVTDPESEINEMLTKEISYTVDMTKKYNNLLNMQESIYEHDLQTSKNFYWDNTVVSMEEEEMESYFILDELGSPIELMDEDGFIRESYSYDEFGQTTIHKTGNNLADITAPQASSSIETTPLQPFGFTGYQMDEAGGLYYAQARRYDAVNGRFVSKDSDRYIRFSRPDSLNQYMYCYDSPLKYVDPSGNDSYIISLGNDSNEPPQNIAWEKNAQEMKEEIERQNPEEVVHVVYVSNEDELVDYWNQMGVGDSTGKYNGEDIADPNINIVVINVHGYNDSAAFGYHDHPANNTNPSPQLDTNEMKERLDEKIVNAVILGGCNMGHVDYAESNVASVIAKLVPGAYVFASDGELEVVSDSEQGYTSLTSVAGEQWLAQVEYALSDRVEFPFYNYGWYIYQYGTNGLTYESVSNYLIGEGDYVWTMIFGDMLSIAKNKE